jgi:ribosome-binding ATPase YchF (GTP1/OBG family)
MRIAIIGLPQSGKTTLFDLATGRHEEPGAYAAPGSMQVGVAHVLDPRMDAIEKLVKPKKTTYASMASIRGSRTWATPTCIEPGAA